MPPKPQLLDLLPLLVLWQGRHVVNSGLDRLLDIRQAEDVSTTGRFVRFRIVGRSGSVFKRCLRTLLEVGCLSLRARSHPDEASAIHARQVGPKAQSKATTAGGGASHLKDSDEAICSS